MKRFLTPSVNWLFVFLAVLVGAMVCGDGQSRWYRRVQFITAYVIMALMFYFMPEARQ